MTGGAHLDASSHRRATHHVHGHAIDALSAHIMHACMLWPHTSSSSLRQPTLRFPLTPPPATFAAALFVSAHLPLWAAGLLAGQQFGRAHNGASSACSAAASRHELVRLLIVAEGAGPA